ncbi:DUF2914 domain-containing protein [Desulfocicer niacini]
MLEKISNFYTLKSMNPLRLILLIIPISLLFYGTPARTGEVQEVTPASLILTQAVMCESIDNFKPQNPAIVFSIDLGKVFCFTTFDQIGDTTHIYHKWFQMDRLVSRKRLTINPPQWSTISSMQLRMADRGPWYVEITDKDDTLLQRLRFSISD